MSRRNLILLFGFVALVAVVAIVATADTNEERGTRAGETYLGDPQTNCVGGICHTERVANWSATDHADADGDFQNKHGTNVYNDSYCGPCHTLGWNEVELGGFNTSQAWNSTHNQKMWMIQCENCHGPASGHGGDPAGINIDRDPYTSCWGYGESACHSGLRQFGYEIGIPGWNQSAHAPYDNPIDDNGLNDYCAECKSPSQINPESSYGNWNEIALEDWRGITCGDCHNPHNVTPYPAQLRWSPEETCDQCHHESRHESLRTEHLAGTPSVNIEDYPYMEDVECVECHMYDTERGVPEEWTTVGHSFEATIEACIACHTDVYDNLPEDDYPHANWTAWNVTLQEALDDWGGVVDAQKTRYEEQLAEAEVYYDMADELKEIAEENGTWTDDLDAIFDQAEYDFNLAEHNSEGAHNPAYTEALFDAAIEGFEEVIDTLDIGTVEGKVTDDAGAGIADVTIIINGKTTKTGSEGMYELTIEPGTYDVMAMKEGLVALTATDVEVPAAVITVQNFTLAPDADKDGTSDADDTDDDNDGVLDTVDEFPNNPKEWVDTDGDGIGDNTDTDDDGDGVDDIEDAAPWDPEIKTKVADIGEEEEADITLYLAIIVVLIIIVIILGMMVAKKGGGAPALPPEEPKEEPPMEESEEIEEEEVEE